MFLIYLFLDANILGYVVTDGYKLMTWTLEAELGFPRRVTCALNC